MSDKYTLDLRNFRSIVAEPVDIAPFTVVYGPNGSGKSSLIYGLLTLKSFLNNPVQNLPSLFSYPTINLGGFDEVVFNHQPGRAMSLSFACSDQESYVSKYTLTIGRSGGNSAIEVGATLFDSAELKLGLDIPFPYSANQSVPFNVHIANEVVTRAEVDGMWTGIRLDGASSDPAARESVLQLFKVANTPMELARTTKFVPLRRGFTSPTYGMSNVTPSLASDLEVASLLAADRFLEYRVSEYMEKVSDCQLRVRTQVGTGTFTVDSIPRKGGTPVAMVNEGFGINQLAYMLAISLSGESGIIAIEEPEIHLHPSMVRNLVHGMTEIVTSSDRRLIVSTHSEIFVVALLAQIAAGKVSVDDVSFIMARKERGESRFTKQEAKSNGQIEGGLDSFITSELEDIAVFLGIPSGSV